MRLLVRLMLCVYVTVFVRLLVPVPVSLEICLQVSVLYSATYTLRDCVIIIDSEMLANQKLSYKLNATLCGTQIEFAGCHWEVPALIRSSSGARRK